MRRLASMRVRLLALLTLGTLAIVLVAGTLLSAQTIRIEPPLVITLPQLDTVLGCLDETFKQVAQSL